TVLVNPKITPLSEEMEEDWEGCLSIPDLRGRVPRYKAIRVQALDRDGGELDFIADGFHARVIQHEVDHLNGKVYLDRMRDFSTLTFLQEFARYWLQPSRPHRHCRLSVGLLKGRIAPWTLRSYNFPSNTCSPALQAKQCMFWSARLVARKSQ